MNIVVIPARGGSKRIPKKNIRNFLGKPIIAYSIEVALESGVFDEVIVSTDDQEIAELAQQYGAKVPFMRPQSLADDYTGTYAVVNHAINWYIEKNIDLQYICCIYATAPFLCKEILQQAYQKLLDTNKNFTYSITSFPFPIQRAVRLNNEHEPVSFYPEMMTCRSQDLPEAYHDAGQFYMGTADAFLTEEKNTIATILPRHLVQDIDTLEDWHRAELMYQVMQKNEQ